jgi:uncharacterized protein (DUF433 family)
MNKVRENISIFDTPAYSASEVTRILNLPSATVKAWAFGYNYNAGQNRFQQVIIPADQQRRLLSFANLCELHILSAIRRHHNVRLGKVRDSIEYLRRELGSTKHPLLDHTLQTNNIDLFVKHASQLLNISRDGQVAMRGDFEQALARIERDNNGSPIRLFPYSRTSISATNQPKSVVIDPRVSFGRPILTSAAIPTEIIADRFLAGDSPTEMAKDYRVEEKEIEEAIRFEQRRAA